MSQICADRRQKLIPFFSRKCLTTGGRDENRSPTISSLNEERLESTTTTKDTVSTLTCRKLTRIAGLPLGSTINVFKMVAGNPDGRDERNDAKEERDSDPSLEEHGGLNMSK
jgi:hypothetical protein